MSPSHKPIKLDETITRSLCRETHGFFRTAHNNNTLIRTKITLDGSEHEVVLKGLALNDGKFKYTTNDGLAAAYLPKTGEYYGAKVQKDGSITLYRATNHNIPFPDSVPPFTPHPAVKKLLEAKQ